MQDDRYHEIDEMDDEDVEPHIDQLDDVSSSQFLTKSEYHYAKMDDYHGTNYFEQE